MTSRSQQDAQPTGPKKQQSEVQGEGDYRAARRYNQETAEYVENADIEKAARDAQPRSAGEAAELERAEQAGKSRTKEEDRLLRKPDNGTVSPSDGSITDADEGTSPARER